MWKAETAPASISDLEAWGHASYVSFLFICLHRGKDSLSSESGQRILVFALFAHTKATVFLPLHPFLLSYVFLLSKPQVISLVVRVLVKREGLEDQGL